MASEIFIPCAGANLCVNVPVAQLSKEPDEVLEVLKAEAAPLTLWLDFARAYLAQGNVDAFVFILTEGTSPEAARFDTFAVHFSS